MRILVTGGAGYIGSVTSTALIEAGHDVTVLDNLSGGHRGAVPKKARLIVGDVADFGQIIPAGEAYDAVVHLAGSIAAHESMRFPERYWHNNTVNTLHLLDVLRERKIRKLVFASTAAVYGDPAKLPISEETPPLPTNTYGMTKLALDMALTSEARAHGLDATSFRFFNVAGAYKDLGERHHHETHIIPLLLAAAERQERFTLHGNDYPTVDGTCLRDYIHVYDLARAIILALGTNHPGEHHIYNLANGKGYTNQQMVDTVKRVTGKDFCVEIGPRRSGDPAALFASHRKAKEHLGWEPLRPSLEQMVREAWEFQSQLLHK